MKRFNNLRTGIMLYFVFVMLFMCIISIAGIIGTNNSAGFKIKFVVMLVCACIFSAIIFKLIISRRILGPIKEIAETSNKLAVGDLDADIAIHKGDEFEDIAVSLNETIKNMREMATQQQKLADAALQGKLDVRGETDAFKGSYHDVIAGTNSILDAVTEELNEARRMPDIRETGEKEENDRLTAVVDDMLEAIEGVNAEMNNLTDSFINGNLEFRACEGKFEGKYREIIEKINKMIDATIKPIKEVASVMKEVAQGNLQASVKGDYKGDHKQIKDTINTAIAKLNEMLGEIHSIAQQVASGTSQVSVSAKALSQGAAEETSTIEALSNSIEQIAAKTKQNAINANKAGELSIIAKDDADVGNRQMNKMLTSMRQINEASRNIAKIIKVIDEIAFQTNILALNAAVEAARAGQHGKGFAVVAGEVRNLAQRSSEAAKETTMLIDDTIKKTEYGTQIANDTAAALNKIVRSVAQASGLVEDIVRYSEQQNLGIEQVNEEIIRVSKVIKTCSVTSRESAAASEKLSSQVGLLEEQLSGFKLNEISQYNDGDKINPEIMQMLENLEGQ